MKKTLSVMLIVCLLLTAVGCSADRQEETPSSVPTVSEVTEELEQGGMEAIQLILDQVPLYDLDTLMNAGTVNHNGVEYYLVISGTDYDNGSEIEFDETSRYYVAMNYSAIYEYDAVDDTLTEIWSK